MDQVNNNLFEVVPNQKSKRKIVAPSTSAYLNPGLDILADDPMCNNAMEIVPNKKRKRARSCEIVAFENTALDTGVSQAAVSEFLARELQNVKDNMKLPHINMREISPVSFGAQPTRSLQEDVTFSVEEPIYENVNPAIRNTSADIKEIAPVIAELNMPKVLPGLSAIQSCDHKFGHNAIANSTAVASSHFDGNGTRNIQINITNNYIFNNQSISLSFIDKLALDSPITSNQSLCLDDDLNESNIMEIKSIHTQNKSTNPFLDDNLTMEPVDLPHSCTNPFLESCEYQMPATAAPAPAAAAASVMPRRLFVTDNNSTISTVNESLSNDMQHEYENVEFLDLESPIYENIDDLSSMENSLQNVQTHSVNKQSKILGYDVTKFSAVDIMNINKHSQFNSSEESNETKKDNKSSFLRAGNRLSKRVFKTLKKSLKKNEKPAQTIASAPLNPYEVPRKPIKSKVENKDSGIENPALKLDNSDEVEDEESLDDEHQYETIKTLRNTHLNTNITPLKVRDANIQDVSQNRTYTPGKRVRFDATLNQEKLITGNSFDYGLQSPGFDAKLDQFQDELENCINEKKIIQQNM